MKRCINNSWDDEAKVWIGTSDDIAGLVLESDSLEVLVEIIKRAAPELIEQNREKGIV